MFEDFAHYLQMLLILWSPLLCLRSLMLWSLCLFLKTHCSQALH